MRTVPFTGMTAARTHLGRVMSIHLHGHRPVQRRFISKECLQFSKAPLAPVAFVCTGFFRGFGVRTPLSTVTDIRQLLKPDERLGEATKNTEAQLVVPVSDKPSLSSAYLNQSSGCGTSAFTLQASTQASIVVFLLAGLLTALKERVLTGIAHDSVITLSNVHPNHLLGILWLQVGHFYFQRNQEIVLLLGLLVIEFSGSYFTTLRDVLKVLGVALVRQNNSAIKSLDAHLLALFPREVTAKVVRQSARNKPTGFIQAFVALLGVPLFTSRLVVAELCPLNRIVARNLTRGSASHLRRQTKLFPQVLVHQFLKFRRLRQLVLTVGHFRGEVIDSVLSR